MTGIPSVLTELMADCNVHGIQLLAADDGGLTIDAPQNALTPDLLDRLKAHKAELLTRLQSTADADNEGAVDSETTPLIDSRATTKAICRCGATTCRDVPIHSGQSVRRECARCRRFIEFPIWYGNSTGHNDQQLIG